MKVVVTGGSGIVGKAVIERLAREGHETLVVGRREADEILTVGARYLVCDVNDFERFREISKGFDAIIHLAAIPNPFAGTPEAIFRTNCTGTYHVYEAAARNDIGRVVTASSINAFGYCYGTRAFPIAHFPVDESTPASTSDPYSFSKQITEEVAAYHTRRYGISSACIRIPWVYRSTGEVIDELSSRLENYKTIWSEIQSMGEQAWQARLSELIGDFDEYRRSQYASGVTGHHPREKRKFHENSLFVGRNNFWTLVDERDSAQAFVKAATADYDGAHVLFVNDTHNWTGIDSAELVRRMFPVPETWTGLFTRELTGSESLVSADRARRLIGFEPEYSLARFF
jgi:nucleoside-diphosphate-sugar epimerase